MSLDKPIADDQIYEWVADVGAVQFECLVQHNETQ